MHGKNGASGNPATAGPEVSRRNFMYGSAATAATAALLWRAGQLPRAAAGHAAAGSPAGQAPASPYLIGDVAVATGIGTTATVSVATATAAGDAIVVCPATTASNRVTGVADTKNNSYTLIKSVTNGALAGWVYVALNPARLTTSDSITVTYGGTSAHNVKAIAVPGATAVDSNASAVAAGSSATPSVTTGTLATANETLVALETNGNGSGAIAWSGTGFTPLRIDGGGTITMAALLNSSQNPTGTLVAGGDVEGFFLSSDQGDHWTVANTGVWSQYWRDCACIAWSELEPNTVYACVGSAGSASAGGLLVSADGGNTWSMRSQNPPVPQFAGNHAASPLPSSGSNPRSTGYLLAQDSNSGGSPAYLYAASYDGGVFRSTDKGQNWTPIGLGPDASGNHYYARSLAWDPVTGHLWAAMYDWDGTGTFGHVWECASPRTASGTANWKQLTASPPIVEELLVVGGWLYAACGGAFPASQQQGIYEHQIGKTGWTDLSSAAGIDTTTSYWLTMDGYQSGSSNVVVWSCDFPVKGPSTYRSLVKTVIDSSGNVTSANFLTDTGNVQLQYIPPDHRLWWHYGSNYQNWLGGSSYINGHVTIDQLNTNNIYVTADNGMYRSMDGGLTWTIASNGMPLFAARSVAVDPADPKHIVLGDSDWCSWDVTDGIAYDANTTKTTPVPIASQEGFALAFDPGGTNTVFIGAADKYSSGGTNVHGDVYSRSPGGPPFTWASTSLGGKTNQQVPIGLAVTRDTSNQYVLAAVTGTASTAGMWRMVNGGTWSQVDAVIGTALQNSAYMPFAVLPGSPNVYVLDRGAGLFRGANYGQSWTKILSFNTRSDTRTGFLALNPAVADELWIAKTDGLFKISPASTFNNGTPTPVPLPGGVLPGAVAIAPDGTVYCLGLGAAPPSSPDTVLLRSVDKGSTWQDVSGPGPGIAANASRPQDMAIASDGRIYIANEANIVAQGYPAAGWTAQGGDLHTGPDEHTGAATQVVASTAPVTATGAVTSGNWLMIVVALET